MKTKVLGGLILCILLLSACNGNPSTTPDMNTLGTAVAKTIEAMSSTLAGTQAVIPLPAEDSTPTSTLEATATFTPSPQETLAATVTSTRILGFCDKAEFISDVTITDGTNVVAGAAFTKTWRMRNVGTCTWTTGYKLVFVSGDSMGSTKSVSLSKSVAPNTTIDISVPMTAPTELKAYTGFWILSNESGSRFGTGVNAADTIYVKINVTSGTPTPTVTGTRRTPTGTTGTPTATLAYFAVVNTVINASPSTYSGTCPTTITVTGTMTVSRAGTVKYHFVRSDGTSSGVKSLVFTAAGSLAISETFQASASGTDTVYIDSPNHQYLGLATYTISCGVPTATTSVPPTQTQTETPIPPTVTPTATPVTPTT
jgi:hypothetical protein